MSVRIALLAALVALTVGCNTTPNLAFSSGEKASTSEDGLVRVDGSGFPSGWLRPDRDFAAYDRIKLVYNGTFYREPPVLTARDKPGSDNYALPAGDLAGRKLEERFRDELFDDDQIRETDESGPGVLVVYFALVGVVLHSPAARPPDEDAMWIDSMGSVIVVIDVVDGMTHERLGHFAVRKGIQPVGRRPIRSRTSDVFYVLNRIFRDSARQLRLVIERLQVEPLTARVSPVDAGGTGAS